MNNIIIDYKLKSDNTWKRVVLDPKDYFDPDDSGFSIDNIEKFYLEPRDYISIENSEILFLNFDVSDHLGKRKLTKYTYWNNGRNQIQDHNEFLSEILTYRTIVQSIELTNGDSLILRLEEINGQLIPITHLIMDSKENFTQSNDLSAFDNLRNKN